MVLPLKTELKTDLIIERMTVIEKKKHKSLFLRLYNYFYF